MEAMTGRYPQQSSPASTLGGSDILAYVLERMGVGRGRSKRVSAGQEYCRWQVAPSGVPLSVGWAMGFRAGGVR